MKVIHPPNEIPEDGYKLFLAGSIEMGAAEDWQSAAHAEFSDLGGLILDPRRPDWDSSQEQVTTNPYFTRQVQWELDGLDAANCIFMYFDPNTKSPISLLELGLHAKSGKLVVCCPRGFWRHGNVDITCHRYGIPVFENIEFAYAEVRDRKLRHRR